MNHISEIRVASDSPVYNVAGAIAHAWRAGQRPVLRAVGARAVDRAVRAVAIAGKYLRVRLACVPDLKVIRVNGQKRTIVTLVIQVEG